MSREHKPGAPRRKESGRKRSATSSHGTPAVFLDRDGTICEEVGYVNHVDRIQVYPYAARAIRKLNRAGYRIVVVTNQSGVGRGYFSERLVKQAHARIAKELASKGARVDAFYYCPHHPAATVREYRMDCRCRKPATGMADDAAKRFHLDLKSSCVVGDSYRDMRLAFNIGARSIMLMTGYGKGEYVHHRKNWPRLPDEIARNLSEAVEIILDGQPRSAGNARVKAKSPR
jgi:D-glycero-D-manno-heptose 1,7-bisphosphate phosphatase